MPSAEVTRLSTGDTWYAVRWDAKRRKWMRRSTGMTTRVAAVAVARRWRQEGELARSGARTAFAEMAELSILEHIDDFMAAKRSSPDQITGRHLEETDQRLRRVVAERGWERLADVDSDGLAASIEQLSLADARDRAARIAAREARRAKMDAKAAARAKKLGAATAAPAPPAPLAPPEPPHDGGAATAPTPGGNGARKRSAAGFSNATKNAYRAAWKSLTRWAHQKGRIASDPLADLAKWRTSGFRSFSRRALAADEVARLLATTRLAPPRQGLSGPDRAMLYLVAIVTGFRWSELASLTPRSFRLDAVPPAVELQAGRAKNRKVTTQPLTPELVADLARWLAGRSRDRVCWTLGTEGGAAMLQADLVEAGIPIRDEHGAVADFHALRHTLGTWLAQRGVSVQAAQRIMRHSSPTVTAQYYTHLATADLAADLGTAISGTDCAILRADETTADDQGGHMTTGTTGEATSAPELEPCAAAAFGVSVETAADPCGLQQISASSRTRTLNPLIKRQDAADSQSAASVSVARDGGGEIAPSCAVAETGGGEGGEQSDEPDQPAAPAAPTLAESAGQQRPRPSSRAHARGRAEAGLQPDLNLAFARIGELAALATGGGR